MFSTALTIIVLVVIAIAAYIIEKVERFKVPEGSALDEPIELEKLREDPKAVKELSGKVASVGIVLIDPLLDSRDLLTARDAFEAYVVDTNGLPVAFAHGGERTDIVEKAEWLAEMLQVPLENHLD